MTALNFSKAAFTAIIKLENFCSPREFMAAADRIMTAGDTDLKAALAVSEAYNALMCEAVLSPMTVEFETEKARLFIRPGQRGTRLLIGFTGRAFRFMMPLAIFQQSLPCDTDLLVLYDSANDHYRSGIFDGKSTLFDLPRLLWPIMDQYSSIISFGTSGGAFPAVRFGKIAQVQRGISIGGRVINDAIRVFKGTGLAPAFDPICDCYKETAGQSWLMFGDQHAADVRSAQIAAASIGAEQIAVMGSAEHNLLWPIYKAGRLDTFLDLLLDPNSTATALRRFLAG